MKFLVDAQLPFRLARLPRELGYDAVYTDDMPQAEFTSDEAIRKLAHRESRIVISKDSDFLDSYFVRGTPKKLLLISTGNIPNTALFALFRQHMPLITNHFLQHSLLELSQEELIIHE